MLYHDGNIYLNVLDGEYVDLTVKNKIIKTENYDEGIKFNEDLEDDIEDIIES